MSKKERKNFTINFEVSLYEAIKTQAEKEARPTGQLIKLVMQSYLNSAQAVKN